MLPSRRRHGVDGSPDHRGDRLDVASRGAEVVDRSAAGAHPFGRAPAPPRESPPARSATTACSTPTSSSFSGGPIGVGDGDRYPFGYAIRGRSVFATWLDALDNRQTYPRAAGQHENPRRQGSNASAGPAAIAARRCAGPGVARRGPRYRPRTSVRLAGVANNTRYGLCCVPRGDDVNPACGVHRAVPGSLRCRPRQRAPTPRAAAGGNGLPDR